jgi:hypothetical protein
VAVRLRDGMLPLVGDGLSDRNTPAGLAVEYRGVGVRGVEALASRRHAMYVSCWTADASAFIEGFTVVLDACDSSERLAREGNAIDVFEYITTIFKEYTSN